MTVRRIPVGDRDIAAPVNRREFLTLRTTGSKRILELSCEPLFMRFVDAQSRVASCKGEDAANPSSHCSYGEPATTIDLPTKDELLTELERQLADVDVLRVIGRDWLSGGDFKRQVEARLETFISRGGRIEFGDATSTTALGGH